MMETIRKFKPIECPNCGAPLRSENCEYCGSYIDLGTNLQIELEIERLRKKIAYEQCRLAQNARINDIFTYNEVRQFCGLEKVNDCVILEMR